MKHLLIIITSIFLLSSCDFSVIQLEVKSISQIDGDIDSLKNNTELKIISFSGFDEKQTDVWIQYIVKDTLTNNQYRIITPQYYHKQIKPKMKYHIIKLDELIALNSLNSISESNDDINELLKSIKGTNFNDVINGEYSKIKVFFNPQFENIESQNLPIIIGELE